VTEDLTDVGLSDCHGSRGPVPVAAQSTLQHALVAEANTSAVYFERSEAAETGRLDLYPACISGPAFFLAHVHHERWDARNGVHRGGAAGGNTNRLLVDLGQRFGSTFLRRFDRRPSGSPPDHVVDASVQYQYVPGGPAVPDPI